MSNSKYFLACLAFLFNCAVYCADTPSSSKNDAESAGISRKNIPAIIFPDLGVERGWIGPVTQACIEVLSDKTAPLIMSKALARNVFKFVLGKHGRKKRDAELNVREKESGDVTPEDELVEQPEQVEEQPEGEVDEGQEKKESFIARVSGLIRSLHTHKKPAGACKHGYDPMCCDYDGNFAFSCVSDISNFSPTISFTIDEWSVYSTQDGSWYLFIPKESEDKTYDIDKMFSTENLNKIETTDALMESFKAHSQRFSLPNVLTVFARRFSLSRPLARDVRVGSLIEVFKENSGPWDFVIGGHGLFSRNKYIRKGEVDPQAMLSGMWLEEAKTFITSLAEKIMINSIAFGGCYIDNKFLDGILNEIDEDKRFTVILGNLPFAMIVPPPLHVRSRTSYPALDDFSHMSTDSGNIQIYEHFTLLTDYFKSLEQSDIPQALKYFSYKRRLCFREYSRNPILYLMPLVRFKGDESFHSIENGNIFVLKEDEKKELDWRKYRLVLLESDKGSNALTIIKSEDDDSNWVEGRPPVLLSYVPGNVEHKFSKISIFESKKTWLHLSDFCRFCIFQVNSPYVKIFKIDELIIGRETFFDVVTKKGPGLFGPAKITGSLIFKKQEGQTKKSFKAKFNSCCSMFASPEDPEEIEISDEEYEKERKAMEESLNNPTWRSLRQFLY